MKPKTTQREILLFADAGFFNQKYCIKEAGKNETVSLSKTEQLEKVCWAGLLAELLPELIPSSFCKAYIWQTSPSTHFLKINTGAHPEPFENETSIDPYFFLPATKYHS